MADLENNNIEITNHPIELNDINVRPESPWYRNRKKLFIVIGSAVLALIALVVVIVVLTGKCKSCDCNPNLPECEPCTSCDCNPNLAGCEPCTSCDCDPTIDGCIVINHKLNEVSVYEDSTTKTSTIVFNDENPSGRRLSGKSVDTTINGKYLFNVYKVDNSTSNKVYNAYAVLLNLENDKTWNKN